jgi:hypothetical protein
MVAPKQQFPFVRWAVLVCSYDDPGTQAMHRVSNANCHFLLSDCFGANHRVARLVPNTSRKI